MLRRYNAPATENQIRFVPISIGEVKHALSFTLRHESIVDCPVTSSETRKYTQAILKHTYNYCVKASSNFATCQLPTGIRHAHSTRKYAPSNISTTISVCELHPGRRLQKYPFPFRTQPDCRPLNPKLLELLNTSVMTENMKPMVCMI